MKKIKKILVLVLATLLLVGCSEDMTAEILDGIGSEILNPNTENEIIEEISDEKTAGFWVEYIDVGQGEAALICSDGRYMLIDGGNPSDSSKIYSILKEKQVEKIDLLIASHPHQDHIGGLSAAYNCVEVEKTLSPVTVYEGDAFKDFSKYVHLYGGSIEVPEVGNKYSFGNANVDILGLNVGEEVNNSSIICKITYGKTSFLFTGDAEYDAEIAVVKSGADLSVDVLKVSHHGSDTSSSYQFLREVMPKVAIISVGAGNEYGHPTESVLTKLSDAGCDIYRTDLNGNITVYSDGENISVDTQKQVSSEEVMSPGNAMNGAISDQESSKTSVESIDFICNEGSRKFHLPSCDSVLKMSEKNKRYYYGTRDELLMMNYEPCGACKP